MLITGIVNSGVCSRYPELNIDDLTIQLTMFKRQRTYSNIAEAQNVVQDMCPEVRSLFCQVEQLIRLLLVCPVASCTAERSFSCLRRLKTWLQTTMTQKRFNSVIVCAVYRQIIDSLDVHKLAKEFASRTAMRVRHFGNWP